MARRNSVAGALAAAAQAAADGEEGDTIEGELQSGAEVDADRIEREHSDDNLRALTEVEGAQDARWQVYRLLPAEKAGFLMEIPTAQLSQAYIAKMCGPGKYRVRGIDQRGRYIGHRTFQIAELLQGAAAPSNPYAPNVDLILSSISQQKQQLRDDIKFWASILAPTLPLLIAWIQSRPKGQGNSLTDLIGAVSGLKALSDPADPLKQIGQIRDLIGAVKDLAPEAPATGSTWVDLVRDLGTQLAPLAVNVLGARAQAGTIPDGSGVPGPRPPPLGPTPSGPGTIPNGTQQGDPMFALMNWLRPQLQMLIGKAAKNSDPELYAELVADNVPPNLPPEQIESFLRRPDWWQLLVQFSPAASPYQGWFTQLRDALLRMIAEGRGEQDNNGRAEDAE